jgi:hypothetical protein
MENGARLRIPVNAVVKTATGEADGVKRRLQARVNLTLGFKPWASMGVLAKKMIDVDMNGVWNTGPTRRSVSARRSSTATRRSRPVVDRHLSQRRSINGTRTTNAAKFEFPDVDHEPYEAVNDNANLRTSGFYTDPSGANANTVRAFRIP